MYSVRRLYTGVYGGITHLIIPWLKWRVRATLDARNRWNIVFFFLLSTSLYYVQPRWSPYMVPPRLAASARD